MGLGKLGAEVKNHNLPPTQSTACYQSIPCGGEQQVAACESEHHMNVVLEGKGEER